MASLTVRSALFLAASIFLLGIAQVAACEAPLTPRPSLTPQAYGQSEPFAPRQLVGDGLWAWKMGSRECYSPVASKDLAISCFLVPPAPTPAE